MFQTMTQNWWMLLIRGIVAVLFGVAVFFAPAIALTVLVLLWGAYALVDGIFAVSAGIRGRQHNRHWWVTLLEGVAGIAAGIVTFLWPEITALVLLYIIAAWAIITGALEIYAAIQLRRELAGEIWMALGGILSIIFGVVLIAWPGIGILSVLWLVAFYAVMFGAVMIIFSFRMRNHMGGQQDRQSGQPHAPQAA